MSARKIEREKKRSGASFWAVTGKGGEKRSCLYGKWDMKKESRSLRSRGKKVLSNPPSWKSGGGQRRGQDDDAGKGGEGTKPTDDEIITEEEKKKTHLLSVRREEGSGQRSFARGKREAHIDAPSFIERKELLNRPSSHLTGAFAQDLPRRKGAVTPWRRGKKKEKRDKDRCRRFIPITKKRSYGFNTPPADRRLELCLHRRKERKKSQLGLHLGRRRKGKKHKSRTFFLPEADQMRKWAAEKREKKKGRRTDVV